MKNELNKKGDGVTCPLALLMKDGRILTGHRNYSQTNSVWTIPGGRSEIGESIKQTLRRELLEEVNIIYFEIVDYIGEATGAKAGDIVKIFLCKTNQDGELMEPEKFSEWRWVSVSEYVENPIYSGFNPAVRKLIIDYIVSHAGMATPRAPSGI